MSSKHHFRIIRLKPVDDSSILKIHQHNLGGDIHVGDGLNRMHVVFKQRVEVHGDRVDHHNSIVRSGGHHVDVGDEVKTKSANLHLLLHLVLISVEDKVRLHGPGVVHHVEVEGVVGADLPGPVRAGGHGDTISDWRSVRSSHCQSVRVNLVYQGIVCGGNVGGLDLFVYLFVYFVYLSIHLFRVLWSQPPENDICVVIKMSKSFNDLQSIPIIGFERTCKASSAMPE